MMNVTTTSLPNQVDAESSEVVRTVLTPVSLEDGQSSRTNSHYNLTARSGGEGESMAAPSSSEAAVTADNGHQPERDVDGDGQDDEEELLYPWQRPTDAGVLGLAKWIAMLPVNFLYFITIPDMRYIQSLS